MAFLIEPNTARKRDVHPGEASEALTIPFRRTTFLITFMVFLVLLPVQARAARLVIGFSGETGSNDIFLGAKLGIDESNRQGKYLEK